MKRFILSILFVSVFFIGVGALVHTTGAKFKSDEKALALMAKARQAIGGDSAVNSVKSLSIVGRTTHSFKIDGALRSEEGETEIALQLPDKMMKMVKIGHGESESNSGQTIEKNINVIVVGDAKDAQKITINGESSEAEKGEGVHRIIMKKADGTTEEINGSNVERHVVVHQGDGGMTTFKTEGGNTVFMKKSDGTERGKVIGGDSHIMFNRVGPGGDHGPMRQNELLRTTLGLLLTAPTGMDVGYTYSGDGDVDGTSCDVVVAEFGGSSYRLYLSKASSLPVMMSYKGMREPQVFAFGSKAPQGAENVKENMVFAHKIEGGQEGLSDINIKFSDYRSVNGVQLPYKWTQTSGEVGETFDVTNYEINPANIEEKFQNHKVMVRTQKPDGQ